MPRDLVRIEQQRTEAGVDPLSSICLQARLTAAQTQARAACILKLAPPRWPSSSPSSPACPIGSILPDHASIPEIPAVTADEAPRTLPGIRIRERPGALQAA